MYFWFLVLNSVTWAIFNNGFMYLWMSSIWVPSSFNFFTYIISGFMAKAFKFLYFFFFFFFFWLSGFTLFSLIIHSVGFGPFNFANYPISTLIHFKKWSSRFSFLFWILSPSLALWPPHLSFCFTFLFLHEKVNFSLSGLALVL